MKKLERATVIVTPEGNVLAEAEELVDVGDQGVEVEMLKQLHGRKPKNPGPLWDGGRPVQIVIKGEETIVSRTLIRQGGTDMDYALPREMLNRRKRLISDRMKQERI